MTSRPADIAHRREPTSVIALLGGERVLGATVKTRLDLARATRDGLPAQAATPPIGIFADVFVDFYMDEKPFWYSVSPNNSMFGPIAMVWRSIMLDPETPSSAFGKRLTPSDSDLVVRVATVLARAIDVLHREKDFRETAAVCWLTQPNATLGGQIPMTMLDTFAGTREVEAALERIESGISS